MRMLLRDLVPGSKYELQIRSKNATEVSEWSPVFALETARDTTPPPVPEGFTVTAEGTSFLATWIRPEAELMLDFSHYEVQIEASPTNILNYFMQQERFDFTYEMNVAGFGEPIGSLTMRVRSVDLSGNRSDWALHAPVGNEPPQQVPNVTAAPIGNGINIAWGLVTDDDIKHYNVYVHTGSSAPTGATTGTVVARLLGDKFTYTTLSYGIDHYFSVRAVDVFNTTSQTVVWTAAVRPINYNEVDTVEPAVPGGLVATAVTVPAGSSYASIDLVWNAVTASDLSGYTVRYSDVGNAGPWSYVDVSPDETTTRVQNLIPGKTYYFQIRAYDYSANNSAFSPVISKAAATDTNAPAAPTGLIGSADPTRISMYWDPVPNAASYVVEIHTNAGYTALAKTVSTTGTVGIVSGLTPETNYYPRVRAESVIGTDGSFATPNPALVTTPKVGMTSVSFDDVTGNLGTDRLFVIADTVGAEVLKATTSFTSDLFVNSTFTLGKTGLPDGIIKSVNYSQANGLGFSLSNAGLDIQQGSINARALRIQEGSNLLNAQHAAFSGNPAMYVSEIKSSAGTHVVETTGGRLGGQVLKVPSANVWVYMGPNTAGTSGNIALEGETTYILSWYARASVAGRTMLPKIRNQGAVDTSGATATLTTTWARYQATITLPAGSTHGAVFWDLGATAADVYVDHVQLERQTSGLTTASPWKPPGLTRIDGGIIRTGEIRSSQTMTIDGSQQPFWSLNTQGNMQINDALVRGSISVGSSASATSGQIQSWNYAPNSTGWVVKGTGDVEFQSGAFRGEITATSLTIGPGAATSGTFNGTTGGSHTGPSTGTHSGGVTGTVTGPVNGNISGATGTFTGGTSGSHTGPSSGTHSGTINIAATKFMVDASGNIGIGPGGTALSTSNPFRVDAAGQLNATGAIINGQITATSLTIGAGATTSGTWAGSVTGPTSGTHSGSVTGPSSGTHSGPSTGTHSGVTTGTNQGTHTGPSTGTHSGSSTGTHSGTTTGTNTGTHTGVIAINGSTFQVDSNGAIGIGPGTYATHSSNPFRVLSNGALYATSATISGTINASGGNFSGTIYGGAFQGAEFRNGTGGVHWRLGGTDWNALKFYPGNGNGDPSFVGQITYLDGAGINLQSSDFGWGRSVVRANAFHNGHKYVSLESNLIEMHGRTDCYSDLVNFNWGGRIVWHRNYGAAAWDNQTMELRDDFGNGPGLTFHHGGIRAMSWGIEAGNNRFAARLDTGTDYVWIAAKGFTVPSDESFKSDIQVLEPGALAKIRKVKAKRFKHSEDYPVEQRDAIGFVAQDLETVGLATTIGVNGDKKGYEVTDILTTLWQALSESEEEKDVLKAQIAADRVEMAAIKNELRREVALLKGGKVDKATTP